MSMSEYSLSDLTAAVNGGEGMGGNSWWILILLFAMIYGGGGFGFGNNGTGAAQAVTTADLQRAIDLNSVQEGQAGISADIQRGIYEINGATKDAAYNNLSEIRDVQSAAAAGFNNTQAQVNAGFANIQTALTSLQGDMQNCCCTTQRAIDGVNYNLATQSAAIQANDTANTQKILDALATNRMAEMQSQINQLQLQNAVSGVVRYPSASTYYAGANPFCGGAGGTGF